MSSRLSLPDDYVAYLDDHVRGSERRLAPLVRELSDLYLGKAKRMSLGLGAASPSLPARRSTGLGGRHPGWRPAYTFYYGPVTALKVQAIAVELALRQPAWSERRKLRLLDLGAGPAAATAGVCLWNADLELEALCVDRDPDWENILVQPWIESGRLRLHRRAQDWIASVPQPPYDLVLAANVLVEDDDVPLRAAERLDRILSRSLAADGVAIVVEPALRQATRNLHLVRERLLGAGWQVLAPCTGAGPCPMLANPRDWCHETRDWIQPDFHHHLDQLSGLKKDALRFSFLVLSRQPGVPSAPGTARVVSEIRREKGRIRFVTCDDQSRSATWEALQRQCRAEPDFGTTIEALERGALVRLPHPSGGRLSPAEGFSRHP